MGATLEDQKEAEGEALEQMKEYLIDFIDRLGPKEYNRYKNSFVKTMEIEDLSDYEYNVANLALQALQMGHIYLMRKMYEDNNQSN